MSQRIEIPLVGGHYVGRSTNVDAQECINFIPMINDVGGKPMSLHPAPGLSTWKQISTSNVVVRALYRFSSTVLYAIVHRTVYKIDTDGNYTALSPMLDNSDGQCKMIDNGVQTMILDLTDGKGYVIESDAVTKITDANYPLSSDVTYQDGYALVSHKSSKKYSISTLDVTSTAAYNASDFTRWDALDFATVSGLNSNLIGLISDHDELWMFGSEKVGFYYNSGNVDFPFAKTQHPFQESGLGGSPTCIVQLDNSLFWLDEWDNIRRASGYTPMIISTPEISYNIEKFSTTSDAIGFGYRHEGQAFYVLTFPAADKTYVYEVGTGIWTLRSSGLLGGRWRANCYAEFAGEHLVGDYDSGTIYKLDHELFTDAGDVFPSIRTTRYINADRRKMVFHRLELHMESGTGNVTSPADDPTISLQWSDDGGHNWSEEKWAKIGKIGAKKSRVIWRKLGSSRDRIFRFKITDQVDRVLIGLYADVTIGRT